MDRTASLCLECATTGNDIITVAPYKPIKIMKACGTPRENQEVREEVRRKDGFSILRDTEVEIEK